MTSCTSASRRIPYLLLLSLAVAALAYASLMLPRETGRVAPVWLANAVTLACLLRTPRRTWWMWLVAGFAGNMAAALWAGDNPGLGAALTACNVVEVLAAAVLLRRAAPEGWDPSLADHLTHLRNTAVAVSLGSATVAVSFLHATQSRELLANLLVWTFADALGLFILTPCLLILRDWRRHLASKPFNRAGGIALAALVVTDVVVFGQNRAPVLFLVLPALVAVGLTLEVLGAAIAIVVTAAIVITLTLGGQGPIALIPGGWTEKLLLQQLFLVVTLGLTLQMSVLQKRRREAVEDLVEARQQAEAQTRRIAEGEARYRLMSERTNDVVVRAALDGELLFLSHSVEVLTGYAVEELLGQKTAPRVFEADRPAFQAVYAGLISGERAPGQPIRYRSIHKDGRVMWLESNPALVREDDGTQVFVDVIRDVTEQMELTEKLAAARAEAERAAAVKSEFLANMSHEIRTPLTSILGFASLLAERTLGEEEDRYVTRVVGASRSLLALVNDVLDFSKLEAGALELRPRPTDPAQCAAEVVELFTAQALAKAVTIRFTAQTDPAQAMVDPDRLRQVLMNLVSNAVKFTEKGGVEVIHAYDGARMRFEVRDTGAGMDAAAEAKLFLRFSQVDASTTRAHGGTGLGLAICKGLVEAMGGEIGVESREGEGSTFWFEIPAEPCGVRAATKIGMLDLDVLGGLRVLAVDDNPANLELVGSLLRPMGVEVTTALGGAAGVKAAAEAPFDLMLMDLRMPEVDGFAAAQAIRQGGGPNSEIPILAFSADISADRAHIFEVFDDVVSKPVELAHLLTTLARWADLDGPAVSVGEARHGA